MNRPGRRKLPDRIQREHGKSFEQVLREYCDRPLTPEEVAGELKCSLKSLFEHGVPLGLKVVRRCEIGR
jgi:hypothetical protein